MNKVSQSVKYAVLLNI